MRLNSRRHAVLLPAALPQQRADGRAVVGAQLGCDAGAGQVVLGVEVLGRRHPLRRDRVRLHRRDLRLPAQPAARSRPTASTRCGSSRQRSAPGDLGRVHRAVRHQAGLRVLRRQRGQHRVRQRLQHRQDHRHLPVARSRSSSTTSDTGEPGPRRQRSRPQGQDRRARVCCCPRSATSSRSTATPTRRPAEKKLVRDAFKEGDVWFNTGDLMRSQGFGHAAFTDRLGDTFRWKGENVATTEVEAAVSTDAQVEEVTVFGVEVPGRRRPGRHGGRPAQGGPGVRRQGAWPRRCYEQAARLRGAAVRPRGRGARAHVDVQEPEGSTCARRATAATAARATRTTSRSRTRSTCCPAATRATCRSTTSTRPRSPTARSPSN